VIKETKINSARRRRRRRRRDPLPSPYRCIHV